MERAMPELPVSPAVWAASGLLIVALFCGVLSALLERSGPIRLRHWAETAGGRLRRLYDDPARFGAFRMLLSLCARVTPLGLLATLLIWLSRAGISHPTMAALITTALVVAAIEFVNRLIVLRDPERSLSLLTQIYRGSLVVLGPGAMILAPLIRHPPVRDEDGDDEASDEEVEAYIDVGTREGILEPEQGEWVSNIVDFGGSQVRSVMTPRIDMVCAPVAATLDELAELFVESGHSRIPLYQDSIDHIGGVLNLRELLRALRAHPAPAVATLLKPPLFVPETKPLGELLKEFQAGSQQVAIVVDEYGGTAGLVTLEDLLEEIVGEIVDEHDTGADVVEAVSEGVWRLDGRTHIELLDELFEVDLEEPGYETVAGLIFTTLGHVPVEGEAVEREGLRLTVEAVENRRIKTVRVERAAAADDDAAEGKKAS
jgi:putative hemolysin